MKFKIGDRVQVTNIVGRKLQKKRGGEIVAIIPNSHHKYLVRLIKTKTKPDSEFQYAESELELCLNGVEVMLKLLD